MNGEEVQRGEEKFLLARKSTKFAGVYTNDLYLFDKNNYKLG